MSYHEQALGIDTEEATDRPRVSLTTVKEKMKAKGCEPAWRGLRPRCSMVCPSLIYEGYGCALAKDPEEQPFECIPMIEAVVEALASLETP